MSYKEYLDNTNKVYTIFKDYFGEDRTDLQQLSKNVWECNYKTAYIIVHFPEFTITNELEETHTIKDMYVRITVNEDKTICPGIQGQRSTLTDKEYISDYTHSHLFGGHECYSSFCLGTGPIKNTLLSLVDSGSDDLWLLFCGELEEFLKVESLSGGPYKKISDLSGPSTYGSSYCFMHLCNIDNIFNYADYKIMIKDFLRYFLYTVPLSFYIIYDKIELAMDIKKFIVLLSNAFFNYYNTVLVKDIRNWSIQELIRGNIINPIKKEKNTFVAFESEFVRNGFDTTIIFKNKSIPGKIEATSNSDTVYGVSPEFVNVFYSLIYNYTNCCNINSTEHEKIYCL